MFKFMARSVDAKAGNKIRRREGNGTYILTYRTAASRFSDERNVATFATSVHISIYVSFFILAVTVSDLREVVSVIVV